jgi:AraC-like DNA-binding protein
MLHEEFEIKDSIQEEMLRVVLKRWLIKSTRILRMQSDFADNQEAGNELLRQFNILVEKHFTEYHNVKDYADLLNKSPKTISNQFRLLGHESPSKIIQDRIIAEAKRNLLYSSNSMKEIAFKLGFENATNFSHFFKSKVGVPPSEFSSSLK